MPAVKRAKTAFTAGELAPELLGRGDVAAYANGAARLRNVFIQPTGGVQRRPGLRHLETLFGPARLAPFGISSELTHLLAFSAGTVRIYREDALVAVLGTPWTPATLPQLAWTQDAYRMIVLHSDVRPHAVTFSHAAGWSVTPFLFGQEPFHRYHPPEVPLTATAAAAGGALDVYSTHGIFTAGYVGAQLRIEGRRVRITGLVSATQVTAVALDDIAATPLAYDWQESAFSNQWGWPVSACFHQNRLVLGGARGLPNCLWMSRTGDHGSFDPGEGLDDQAIAFALAADGVDAIRAVFPGRQLQVLTSGAEWVVTGEPLTPASVQVARQSRVGSMTERMLPPVDVDGMTVFAARDGQGVHELSQTDAGGPYQARDLGLAARHLVRAPVSMAYDGTRRLLHLATADGGLATLTLYRDEQVTGWTRQETDGLFRAVAAVDDAVYAVVERAGSFRLERFDEALATDAALSFHAPSGGYAWGGFGHLEGRTVAVRADGAPRGLAAVSNGVVNVDPYAVTLEVGLPFTHVVEPLPPETVTPGGARTGPVRLVAATFRLLATGALSVDLGRGPRPVPFRRLDTPMLDAAPPPFTGDVTLRGLGWRRGIAPLWRIESDAPLPFTLLSVTTETRTTD